MTIHRAFTIIAVFFLIASQAGANVVGTDAQNFNTTTDGLDFVTVQSSETLAPGVFNFGLFLNYAVNTLPYFEANPYNRSSFNDSLLGGDINFGLGLLKNWDIGLSIPEVLTQSVANTTTAGGQFNSYGNTEIRPNTKVHVLGDESQGVALIASANFNRIQNNPYSGAGSGPTFNLEIAGEKRFGPFATALNVGRRWRSAGTQIPGIPIQPFGDSVIYSVGANYLFSHVDTKAIFEIFGSSPLSTSNTDVMRAQTSLEALLGFKHDFTTHLAFHAGFGTQLGYGIASPDWRIYTGINYTFGPLWRKADDSSLQRVASPAPEPKPTETFVARNILFEFNSDVLTGDYAKTLADLEHFLHNPTEFSKLVIEGHTDSVGSEAYNMNLSQRRADAIKKYMIATFKLETSKIESIGYGPTKPIADNGNFQGRQLNRRVEFKVDR